ncbi:MAG: ABC transporter permease [Gemmatimonadales bacterium]
MRPDEELPLSRELPVDEDVRRELEHHLAERERELLEGGLSPEAARAEARRTFGNLDGVNAECRTITRRARRSVRWSRSVDALAQDLVLAWRLLSKTPAYTTAAVLTLALGIGANAAIFSVVNRTLLQPLPYDRPDELVDIVQESGQGWWSYVPWANMLDLRAQSRSFDGMASYTSGFTTVLTEPGPVATRVASVSQDYFATFHVAAARGRLPAPEEHRVGALPVAVISHDFWIRQFNGASDFARQRIRTDREYQVIGVLPEGFAFPEGTDIWLPIELFGMTTSRTAHNEATIARLRPGATVASADRELDDLTARLASLHAPDFDALGARVQTLQSRLTTTSRSPLYLLLGASALLLLTACTNLASTILARGMARQQEVAVRLAIGAGRLRIIRQLVTESLLLAGLGCLAGLGIAYALLGVFTQLAPASLRLTTMELDGWVLLFTGLTGVTTTVLIGLFPALRTSDASPGMVMRQGGRTGRGRSEQRIWGGLVVAEVALAVTLLCGSLLLIRSFGQVLEVDPGFRTDSILTAEMDLPTAVYADDTKLRQGWIRMLEAARTRPEVARAAMITVLPLTYNPSGSFGIEGVPTGPAGYGPGNGGYRMISEGYFDVMGIPVRRGRDFDRRDVTGAPATVIVNEALVQKYFSDRDPLGLRIQLQSGMDQQGDNWLTIVGIVGDVHHNGLTRPVTPEYFVPLQQRPSRGSSGFLVVRARGQLDALVDPLRAALRAVAPDVVPDFASMDSRLQGSMTDRRFTMVILSAFAVVSLLLAGVGIYGVVSYTAAQRSREMGIRLALGATPVEVRAMVQGHALRQVALGLLIGSLGALFATRLMRSLLYEVQVEDPQSFALAIGLLFAAAWIASFLPARRAARLDPMVTIRSE